jgi:hypothetical protein
MNRRIVLAAVGAVLAASTATPALAAKTPPCASFTDAKGDGAPTNDPALDITSVTYKTVGKELVASMTLDKLADRPQYAVGNRFQFDFKLAGHDVTLYYKTSPTRSVEENAFYQQGYRVDGTFVSDAVTGTVNGNTVSIAIGYSTLKGDLGAVLGKPLTALTATALASYVAQNESWDTAAGSMSYVAGSACK